MESTPRAVETIESASSWADFHQSVAIRPYRTADASSVCDWVNEDSELQLISGETELTLTPDIIARWVDHATRTFVFQQRGLPIAFATASVREARLPGGSIEICHLVVRPAMRRKYHGSFFCKWITKLLLAGDGYHSVAGRVVPSNVPGLALMRHLGWKEIAENYGSNQASCRWFTAHRSRYSE